MNGKKVSAATALVFLKAPKPGVVKTRIALAIGDQRAALLYRSWIGRVLTPLQSLRPGLRIIGLYSEGLPREFAQWDPLVDEWWPQSAGDLGARLENGFARGLESSQQVMAIGTDCLEIDADLIEEAIHKLNATDVVLGPAGDGGYYLIGASRPVPGLFAGIRWSSRQTAADQIARCRELGYSLTQLEMKDDIDTWEDWQRFCQRRGESAD